VQASPREKSQTTTGEYDVGLSPRNAAEYAGLFEHAELAVQHGAGHFVRGERAHWCHRWLVQVL